MLVRQGKGGLTPFAECPLSKGSPSENGVRTDGIEGLCSRLELLDNDDCGVILQVLANPGQVDDGFDAV